MRKPHLSSTDDARSKFCNIDLLIPQLLESVGAVSRAEADQEGVAEVVHKEGWNHGETNLGVNLGAVVSLEFAVGQERPDPGGLFLFRDGKIHHRGHAALGPFMEIDQLRRYRHRCGGGFAGGVATAAEVYV